MSERSTQDATPVRSQWPTPFDDRAHRVLTEHRPATNMHRGHLAPRPWRVVRRVPAAAWVCALVACLNAACWSFITPPFEVPDEPDHFAYVKQLAETGTRPTSNEESLSREEALALVALHYPQVRLHPATRAIFSQAQQQRLESELQTSERIPEKGSPHAGLAASEPPLYYALESIPYILGSGGTLLDRLQLMRLLSALMAAITALFTFMFLREALPGARWAWTVGALCVALSPLFGFMSGAVNPDAMLFAVSAALFYCLARAFRHGLTQRSAIATGLVIATGFMTKLNFAGLAPGAFLAILVLAVRGARSSGRSALRAPAIAAAIGCAPVALFLLENTLSNHSTFGIIASAIGHTHGSLLAEANYIWQLYLPRLPGTVNDFPGLSTTRQIWFDGYVGRFGWLDTFFPTWVYTLALIPAGLIVCLFTRALITCRALLHERRSELAVYAAMTGGVLLLVGADSYLVFPKELAEYGQARYLLPMLPLLGAVLALSARAAGRRWGTTVGALMVLLFLAHDIFSQLQVVARYYG
jgi:Predicted membrane protein (DUF2142)